VSIQQETHDPSSLHDNHFQSHNMTSRPKPPPTGQEAKHRKHSWRQGNVSVFQRKDQGPTPAQEADVEAKHAQDVEAARQRDPRTTKYIEHDGESGRSWFNPLKFVTICAKSTCKASMLTNILWPFTIAAMVLHFHYNHPGNNIELWIFITAYIGMIPAANLVGFAGQELARKLPKVLGVVLETTFGSLVEIVLFMVLLKQPGDQGVTIIRAAILGSLLANLLLCLGLCFFIGGIFHPNQTFHEAISEVGSNLMLVAGMGLIIPSIFYNSLSANYGTELLEDKALHISRITAIILLVAFLVYMWFQIRSHHGLYEDILEADEKQDHDRHKDLLKDKLTFTEAVLGVVIGVTFVSFMAVFLAQQIEVSLPFNFYPK
jgi:Ca2+:H+ antiporter